MRLELADGAPAASHALLGRAIRWERDEEERECGSGAGAVRAHAEESIRFRQAQESGRRSSLRMWTVRARGRAESDEQSTDDIRAATCARLIPGFLRCATFCSRQQRQCSVYRSEYVATSRGQGPEPVYHLACLPLICTPRCATQARRSVCVPPGLPVRCEEETRRRSAIAARCWKASGTHGAPTAAPPPALPPCGHRSLKGSNEVS